MARALLKLPGWRLEETIEPVDMADPGSHAEGYPPNGK
jgi:hypothetical protein